MDNNEKAPLGVQVPALLAAALRGDDAAEFALRDIALIDLDAADAYLIALQAGVSRESAEDARTPAAIVAVADQVQAGMRDLLVGGWGRGDQGWDSPC